jgi:hypothetical protein
MLDHDYPRRQGLYVRDLWEKPNVRAVQEAARQLNDLERIAAPTRRTCSTAATKDNILDPISEMVFQSPAA